MLRRVVTKSRTFLPPIRFASSQQYDQLYEGHIPTTQLQKYMLTIGSSYMSLFHPERGDMIAVMGEVTGSTAALSMRSKMMEHEVGRQILEEKPRINSRTTDFKKLKSLPDGTFGREFIRFLEDERCHPDDRLPVHYMDDPDLAYVIQRYREVHDILHHCCGMPTHMLGEVTIKWVEGLQLGLPLGLFGGLLGASRLGTKHRQLYLTTHLPFAIRVGLRGNFYMNFYFEKRWEQPMDELRKEMNIPTPPETPKKKSHYGCPPVVF